MPARKWGTWWQRRRLWTLLQSPGCSMITLPGVRSSRWSTDGCCPNSNGWVGHGRSGAVSVAGEHLAAAAVQRRLSAAFDAAALDSGRSPLLLTGLPPGCRHELGILAFATAARRQGLAVVYLGPDLPLRDWLTAADRHQPDAVVIAVPTLSDVAAALEIVEGFAGRQELVAIGGRHQDAVLEAAGRLRGRSAVPLGQSIAGAASQLRDRLVPP